MDIDTHIAMSLYQFNINSYQRANKIYRYFEGDCAEISDLIIWVDSKNWATEMPLPTAKVYLQHALECYGEEATARRRAKEI